MQEEQQEYTEQQQQEWVREQFQKANKHLAENGVLFDSVITEDCRYLGPFLAIWKIRAQGGQKFWVITGDIPTDFAPISAATSAREVLKYFSLQWQLKAENLLSTAGIDATTEQYTKLLVTGAENIYGLSEKDELWQ